MSGMSGVSHLGGVRRVVGAEEPSTSSRLPVSSVFNSDVRLGQHFDNHVASRSARTATERPQSLYSAQQFRQMQVKHALTTLRALGVSDQAIAMMRNKLASAAGTVACENVEQLLLGIDSRHKDIASDPQLRARLEMSASTLVSLVEKHPLTGRTPLGCYSQHSDFKMFSQLRESVAAETDTRVHLQQLSEHVHDYLASHSEMMPGADALFTARLANLQAMFDGAQSQNVNDVMDRMACIEQMLHLLHDLESSDGEPISDPAVTPPGAAPGTPRGPLSAQPDSPVPQPGMPAQPDGPVPQPGMSAQPAEAAPQPVIHNHYHIGNIHYGDNYTDSFNTVKRVTNNPSVHLFRKIRAGKAPSGGEFNANLFNKNQFNTDRFNAQSSSTRAKPTADAGADLSRNDRAVGNPPPENTLPQGNPNAVPPSHQMPAVPVTEPPAGPRPDVVDGGGGAPVAERQPGYPPVRNGLDQPIDAADADLTQAINKPAPTKQTRTVEPLPDFKGGPGSARAVSAEPGNPPVRNGFNRSIDAANADLTQAINKPAPTKQTWTVEPLPDFKGGPGSARAVRAGPGNPPVRNGFNRSIDAANADLTQAINKPAAAKKTWTVEPLPAFKGGPGSARALRAEPGNPPVRNGFNRPIDTAVAGLTQAINKPAAAAAKHPPVGRLPDFVGSPGSSRTLSRQSGNPHAVDALNAAGTANVPQRGPAPVLNTDVSPQKVNTQAPAQMPASPAAETRKALPTDEERLHALLVRRTAQPVKKAVSWPEVAPASRIVGSPGSSTATPAFVVPSRKK